MRFFAIYRTPSKHTMKPAALVEPLSFRDRGATLSSSEQRTPVQKAALLVYMVVVAASLTVAGACIVCVLL